MKKIILILLCLSFFNNISSQTTMKTRKWRNSENDSLVKAQAIFEARNYPAALKYFEKILANHPDELYLRYVVGICGLYRSDMHEKSLEYLTEAYSKSKKIDEINLDLARAQHYNYKFDDALANIDLFLKQKNLTEIQKKEANLLRDFCNNAKDIVPSPLSAKIENIGKVVNTSDDEYAPVVSSDESVMMFTYRGVESTGGLEDELYRADTLGNYTEDVFITHKENGKWSKPKSIGENINTNTNDASIGISNDGQRLLVYRDDGTNGGDIYMSTLHGNIWSLPEKLAGDVNTLYWEGSASLSADEKTLYFASERPGGIGGKDLYKASLLPDGTWGNVQNLGIDVNTVFDDDAPFIHPDGKTLFYSTLGQKSIGYNDIFVSRFNAKDSSWSRPENIGYPINTADDDKYFVLNASGTRAYYSSGKFGGSGGQDIYSVEMPANFPKPVVQTVKGKITIDDKPTLGAVQVDIISPSKNYGHFHSNAISGNYLVNIVPGNSYKFTFKVKGFPELEKTIDATNLKAYEETLMDINFASKLIDSLAFAATTLGEDPYSPLPSSSKNNSKTSSDLAKTNAASDASKSANGKQTDKNGAATATDGKGTAINGATSIPGGADNGTLNTGNAGNLKSSGTYMSDATGKKPIPDNTTEAEKKAASKLGNAYKEGLTFTVQIASLRSPENFNTERAKKLGKATRTVLDDGMTRITVGKFNTLNQALAFKKEVREAGYPDAFVTAIYKNKRIYVSQLEKLGLVEFDPKSK